MTFNTMNNIINSSISDLMACPGINGKLYLGLGEKKANRIYNAFHSSLI